MAGRQSRLATGSGDVVRVLCAGENEESVIVAVVAVGVVQVAIHKVVNVVAMGDSLMAAAGAMDVAGSMSRAAVVRRALVGIGRRDLDDMLVHMVTVGMVEVAVMDIIHMVAVGNSSVTTVGTVGVVMVGVDSAVGHGILLLARWKVIGWQLPQTGEFG